MLIWVAWGITFAIFAALTAFVVLSKWDFSFMGLYLFAGTLILMGWGLINMLMGYHGSFMYAAFGAALMSGYIIYDTDNIMKRMGPDDWALACVAIDCGSKCLAMISALMASQSLANWANWSCSA